MATWQLKPADHPDLSEALTHFTGRARHASASIDTAIRAMSAPERLESILREQQLRPAVTYSGGLPAVCFTESTVSGLEYLIAQRGFQPWGIAVRRQWVYDQGGAPVWHVRPEDQAAVEQFSPRLRTWTVRLDPDTERPSDWLHEREWRVPCEHGSLALDPDAVVAIIIGDPHWAPEPVGVEAHVAGALDSRTGIPTHDLTNPYTIVDEIELPIMPDGWEGKPRWYWTGEQLVELPPD